MWVMVMVVICGAVVGVQTSWVCPDIKNVSCTCDIPHTLRCTGTNSSALKRIASSLKNLPPFQNVSRLDCSIQRLMHINEPILEGVSLHGLVISSGTLLSVAENAFSEIKSPLEALGLPNNQLAYVPILAISRLVQLRRLDLSHNRLKSLGSHSFQGLFTLRFLDLSWNRLSNISSKAFTDTEFLETLRLQSNNLDGEVVSRFQGLPNLLEMDISHNRLSGPLKPDSFPKLTKLKMLNLSFNQISSIMMGSLAGLESLQSLNVEHNMIDVLEDFAFKALPALNNLNLAHNRIIAFSESSFSQLTNLTTLDLSNNFLRALGSDLLGPIISIRELKVDENDITRVSAEALKSVTSLRVLTLSKNPLNCDCSLLGFVEWLNKTTMELKKNIDAVCAIPPSLENAFVDELLPQQLVCGQDDSVLNSGTTPILRTRVMLQGFEYNGTHVFLLWLVDGNVLYQCGELFIYEELGSHEVLLETESLTCNSGTTKNPHFLSVAHDVSHMEKGHKYRYCITMKELRQTDSDHSGLLVSGCSEIMALKEVYPPRIAVLKVVNPALTVLEINAESWPQSVMCSGKIIVYSDSLLIQQIPFFCNNTNYTLTVPPIYGHYNVCILLGESTPECTTIYAQHILPHPYMPLIILLFLFTLLVLLLIIMVSYRYCIKRTQPPIPRENFFLSKHLEENGTARYVKLHATSKL